jgi:hypothetical protein
MFLFMTHNEALMWSRFERLIAIVVSISLVVLFESTGAKPTWIITSITVVIGQLLALKCWIDMIRMSQPDQNCWAFKG